MPSRAFSLAVLGALGLSGCAVLDPRSNYSVESDVSKLVGATQSMREALTRKSGDSASQGLVDEACFSGTGDVTQQATCRTQRNQMMAVLVIASENACLAHRRSMYGNEAMTNIGLGTATNLFSGMAAVLSESQPARAARYAAIALFSNSERSLGNETVYKMMLVTAIDKKIVEQRNVKALALHANTAKSIAEYGVGQALQDWSSFHASCSFMDGLRLALDEGTQGGNAQKMLRLKQALNAARAERGTLQCGGTRVSNPPAASNPASAAGAASAPEPAASAPTAQDDCAAVAKRIAALNEELGALEKQ